MQVSLTLSSHSLSPSLIICSTLTRGEHLQSSVSILKFFLQIPRLCSEFAAPTSHLHYSSMFRHWIQCYFNDIQLEYEGIERLCDEDETKGHTTDWPINDRSHPFSDAVANTLIYHSNDLLLSERRYIYILKRRHIEIWRALGVASSSTRPLDLGQLTHYLAKDHHYTTVRALLHAPQPLGWSFIELDVLCIYSQFPVSKVGQHWG